MLSLLAKKVFGTKNDRVLKSLKPLVEKVNELEETYQKMSDEELKKQTILFKERYAKDESLDDLMPEAFAAVREASVRCLGMRHFDVQLIGGAVLHQGMISEMKTGEGKTLVATLPAYLNALTGKSVHVVTVNDYLARRDAEWMGSIYRFLGLSVGVVYAGMEEEEKRAAYQADITYGQNNEFGFDFLRDNMKFSLDQVMQRGHHFAIVDEVDSILIDEARTPLIISGPAEESTDKYYQINKIIPHLKQGDHFDIDLKTKQPSLKEDGIAKAEELLKVDNLYDPGNIELLHHVTQALRAYNTMVRDTDYVVRDGQVIIVDEFTGRLMTGRRWSNGLHQAVEAKEGLTVARENQTLASITFQNYFRMYEKLSGMTGTADTEAAEFHKIYKLEVVVIPTNQPMVRDDQSDRVYRTRKEKYEAVVEDILKINKTGQPVLIGTISIEQSENLAKHLERKGVPHNVLNAKQHEREAEIVAQAGRFNAITISTNMAGRGTDIVLGGNPEFLATAEAGTKDKDDPAFQEALKKYSAQCAEEKKKVIEAGGLFIMGTERHESRRIDNQLRGRAGRQGDPGTTRFYISLEDDLMARFGGEKVKDLMHKMGWSEGLSIDGRLISGKIESAQRKVESFHFEGRKHVTDYDDVINKQRQVIYDLRSKVLKNENVDEEIDSMIDDLLEEAVLAICDEKKKPITWDLDALNERFSHLFNSDYKISSTDISLDAQVIFDTLRKEAKDAFSKKVADINIKMASLEEAVKKAYGDEDGKPSPSLQLSRLHDKPFSFETVKQDAILETLDYLWNAHLQEMDHLREGVGLRGYGQKNPLHEYQREGFILFQQLMLSLKELVMRRFFHYEVPDPRQLLAHLEAEQRKREALEKKMQLIHDSPIQEKREGGGTLKQDPPKDIDAEKAKLAALRKARRQKK